MSLTNSAEGKQYDLPCVSEKKITIEKKNGDEVGCVDAYTMFYVDKWDGKRFHVVGTKYWIDGSGLKVGNDIPRFLKNSKCKSLAKTVKKTVAQKCGTSIKIASIPKDTILTVDAVNDYRILTMYDEEICNIPREDVHIVYMLHQFDESAIKPTFEQSINQLSNSLSALNDVLDKLQFDNTNLDLRNRITNFALQYVGGRYVWGSSDPSTGFDCSGLVQYCYGQFGVKMERTSYTQCYQGKAVQASTAKVGDLLFFWNNKYGRVGHVAIYLGNDTMLEAKGSKSGIVVSKVRWSSVYSIRNVID